MLVVMATMQSSDEKFSKNLKCMRCERLLHQNIDNILMIFGEEVEKGLPLLK